MFTNILSNYANFSANFSLLSSQTVKEELEINRKVVNQALDQVRQISKEGAELLSASEISNLQRSAESIKSRYDTSNVNADKLLRRIDMALEELQKFSVSIIFDAYKYTFCEVENNTIASIIVSTASNKNNLPLSFLLALFFRHHN